MKQDQNGGDNFANNNDTQRMGTRGTQKVRDEPQRETDCIDTLGTRRLARTHQHSFTYGRRAPHATLSLNLFFTITFHSQHSKTPPSYPQAAVWHGILPLYHADKPPPLNIEKAILKCLPEHRFAVYSTLLQRQQIHVCLDFRSCQSR